MFKSGPRRGSARGTAGSLTRSCPPRILKSVFHRFPQKRTIKISKIFTQFNGKKNKFEKLNFISKNYLTNQKIYTIIMSTTKKEKRKKKTENKKLTTSKEEAIPVGSKGITSFRT